MGHHSAEEELVLASVRDGVGTLVINRPARLNTFNLPLARQFLAKLEQMDRDSSVRCLVIRGEGKVFSAGGDIQEMWAAVKKGEDRAAYFRAPLAAFGDVVRALRSLPKPVLAAVHGAVAGVAFNTMLACDLRMAAEGTRFTQAFIRIGLSPDGGGTWLLPRLVGYARACEMTLLPTEFDAEVGRAWGLINWVVPKDEFEERITETAQRLAQGPAAAIARTKVLMNAAWENDLAAQLEAERLAQIENAASPDLEEGLAAFLEKRTPSFGRIHPVNRGPQNQLRSLEAGDGKGEDAMARTIRYEDGPPSGAEYNRLRLDAGWPVMDQETAERALWQSCFSVRAYDGPSLAGIGRVVGDFGLCFFVQDVIVLRTHQGLGIGDGIMRRLMDFISKHAVEHTYVGLMAAAGKEGFYHRYGFESRPTEGLGCGMTMFWKENPERDSSPPPSPFSEDESDELCSC